MYKEEETNKFIYEMGRTIGFLGVCAEEALALIENRPSPRNLTKEQVVNSLQNATRVFQDIMSKSKTGGESK